MTKSGLILEQAQTRFYQIKFLPEKHDVKSVAYFKHKKDGRPDSLRVEYRCGINIFREWKAIESPTAKRRVGMWWAKRTDLLLPNTVDEALLLVESFACTNKHNN